MLQLPVLLFTLLVLFADTAISDNQKCVSRDYNHGGTVCVCTADQCDTIPKPEKVEPPQYLVYTSNQAGLRFEKSAGEFSTSNKAEKQIKINRDQKYQTILGWGGAFTDATGINVNSLEENLQKVLLQSYFSEDGIEYSLCRVPIGGTDFSTHGYSYDDGDPDPELKNFALDEADYQFKIPLIKKALELTNNSLQLFASAWTAPKWMKTNGEYSGWGFLKTEMYQAWADYFVKFLDGYKLEGVSFWGITTGNEPNTIFVPGNKINIVGWTTSDICKWIVNNLGPTIRNSNHSDIKIMIFDDQRLFLPGWVDLALENDTAKDYIDGIAVHWYTDFFLPASLLTDTHNQFPDKFLLATEACNGVEIGIGPVVLGSWDRGEDYSNDIIDDIENWVTGWVDWNMVLDLTGGPTYISNFVDSPIIVNTTGGEFYKQPMYYHLGHFSKFVPRDSIRIESSSTLNANVKVVAFQKPDNSTVIIILNKSKQVVQLDLTDGSVGTAHLELTGKSITTLLYW